VVYTSLQRGPRGTPHPWLITSQPLQSLTCGVPAVHYAAFPTQYEGLGVPICSALNGASLNGSLLHQ